jgi:D-aspartate ligase
MMMRSGSQAIPAIVLGSGRGALGVVRRLHEARIPLVCLGADRREERWSRWYRRYPEETPGRPLRDILADCPFDKAVLLPCSDATALEVSRLPVELRNRFPASVARTAVIERLADKAAFAQLLARLGVPHPLTLIPERPTDLDAIPEAVLHGAFLKPRNSSACMAVSGKKGFRVTSRREARETARRLADAGIGIVVQDYIPGPASMHYFLDGFRDAAGRTTGLFGRRRIRMHPPDFGSSCAMLSVDPAGLGQVASDLDRVLGDQNYRGPFNAEFKFDARDGKFKLIEINPRLWWFVEFAARCGVDTVAMAYADALRWPVPVASALALGVRMVDPTFDVFAAWREWKAGRLTLGEWAKFYLGAEQPLFNWSDPMPWVSEFVQYSVRGVRRTYRSLGRRPPAVSPAFRTK